MSKHNGYMINGVRLSKRGREGLMRLVVKYHGGMGDLHQELVKEHEKSERHRRHAQAANNLLVAAVEAGDNIRKQREEEKAGSLDLILSLNSEVDGYKVNAERDAATIANLKLELETRKALHAASNRHARFWLRVSLLAGPLGALITWAATR